MYEQALIMHDNVHIHVIMNVIVTPRSWLLITLIKCLKGHKCLGSLCSVVKTLIVSGAQPTKGQGHLLSCRGTAKNATEVYMVRKELVKVVISNLQTKS